MEEQQQPTKPKQKSSPKGGKPPPGTPRNHRRTQIRKRPDVAEIQAALCSPGASLRKIANQFGVHESSLVKFRRSLPQQVRAAILGAYLEPGKNLEDIKLEEGRSLLLVLRHQRGKLIAEQEAAAGDPKAVAALANSIIKIEELIARHLGELAVLHRTETVNITLTPEYLKLRQVLLKVTAPYPEIRREIAAAIAEIESEATARIESKAPAPKVIEAVPTEGAQ